MSKQIKTGNLARSFNFERSAIDVEARTVHLTFSTENSVERWFGHEVLDHQPESVDLTRLESGAPFLLNHSPESQIGVVEHARIEDGKGKAIVRFSKSDHAQEIFNDVIDGIRTGISVGYRILEMEVEDEKRDGVEVYRATRWMPYEISSVSIPADITATIGRSDEVEGDHVTTITNNQKEKIKMSENKTETIDIKAVANDAMEAERSRVAGITLIADKHPQLKEFSRQFINSGKSLDDFRQVALETITSDMPKAPSARADDLGLTEKEQNSYSLLRAVKAHSIGDWSNASFEREVSIAIEQKVGTSNGGFFIPADLQWGGKRDLTAGTSTAGGHTVATDHYGDSFIDALRANLVVEKAGARFMANLQGNVAIPALDSATSVYWVAENGSPTEGAPTFRQVTMSPKTVAAYVDISRTLMNQSDPSVEAILRADLAAGVAGAIDTVALNGGGSNEPSGILQTSGIGAVTLAGLGDPTFGEIVDIETQISQDNALTGALSYITTPAVLGAMKQKAKDSGSGIFVADGMSANGHPVYTTSNCSANTIIFGNFSDLVIGQFGAIEVVTQRSATSGALTLGIFSDVDVAVRHAESFAKGTGGS